MVRASIIGAILANLMLAMGVAFLLGGLRYHTQEYNAGAARLYSSMMLISAVSLGVPSAFNRFFSPESTIHEEKLVNLGTAFVLLAAYALYLVFLLKTHPDYFASASKAEAEHGHDEAAVERRAGSGQPGRRVGARGLDERDPGRRRRGHRQGARHVGGLHRHRLSRDHRRSGRERIGGRHGAQEQAGPDDRHRHGQQHPNRACSSPRCWCWRAA